MAVEFLGRELTVQRVLDAYTATGLKPVAAFFTCQLGDARCGCALSAVAIAEGAATFEEDGAEHLDRPYGFVAGFDDPYGVSESEYRRSKWEEAYELGRQCREAVGL